METVLKSIAIPADISKSPQVLPAETVNASPDFALQFEDHFDPQ